MSIIKLYIWWKKPLYLQNLRENTAAALTPVGYAHGEPEMLPIHRGSPEDHQEWCLGTEPWVSPVQSQLHQPNQQKQMEVNNEF